MLIFCSRLFLFQLCKTISSASVDWLRREGKQSHCLLLLRVFGMQYGMMKYQVCVVMNPVGICIKHIVFISFQSLLRRCRYIFRTFWRKIQSRHTYSHPYIHSRTDTHTCRLTQRKRFPIDLRSLNSMCRLHVTPHFADGTLNQYTLWDLISEDFTGEM